MILARAAGARRRAGPLQRLQHVGHDDHRRGQASERRQLALRDDQQAGARLDGGGGEVVAVEALAADGEEGFAGLQRPGVDGDARVPAGSWPTGRPPVAWMRSSVVQRGLMRHAP